MDAKNGTGGGAGARFAARANAFERQPDDSRLGVHLSTEQHAAAILVEESCDEQFVLNYFQRGVMTEGIRANSEPTAALP
jgi:hypothetical protein